jgi:hypothetical protein
MKKVALALATLALSFGMVAGMARAYPSPGEMLVQADRLATAEMWTWGTQEVKTYNRWERNAAHRRWELIDHAAGPCRYQRTQGVYSCPGFYILLNRATREELREYRQILLSDPDGDGVLVVKDVKETLGPSGGGNFGPSQGGGKFSVVFHQAIGGGTF